MAILLTVNSFKGGKYNLADAAGQYTIPNVQQAIDNYEKQYLYKLFGVTLGDLIIAYLAANRTPTNTDYDKVIDAFSMDNNGTLCGKPILQSLGLTEYLTACVFYEYKKNGLKDSQSGVQNVNAETATAQGPASVMRFAENKFNDILETADTIQWYCLNNESAFPDFNGERIVVKASQFFI